MPRYLRVGSGIYDANVSSLPESLDRNAKGNIAEAAVVFHAARLGIQVSRPLLEHGRYDLVMEIGSRLLRVQCKWAQRQGAVVLVRLASNRFTPSGYVRTLYLDTEIDAVAAYCGELDRCYLLPAEIVTDKSAIQLRLTPPRNEQRAGIRWAADYELSCALARGVNPGDGIEAQRSGLPAAPRLEVSGRTLVVGAHEFRNRFGYYMELVASGAEVDVTRHGRSYVRLVPPTGAETAALHGENNQSHPPNPSSTKPIVEVDPIRIELTTSALPRQRSTN